MTSSPLSSFFLAIAVKNKDIALKLCMRVVFMHLDHIYSGFFDNLKILDFIGNHFWKIKILNLRDQNRQNIENPTVPFLTVFNFTPLDIFRLRLTSKLNILVAFKHMPFFTRNGETSHWNVIFSKKNLNGFFWYFGGRRQIDAGESFASISAAVFELSRKSGRGGGRICPPSLPSARWDRSRN